MKILCLLFIIFCLTNCSFKNCACRTSENEKYNNASERLNKSEDNMNHLFEE